MALSDRAAGSPVWAFGAIQAGAYNNESTAQIWDRLRSAMEAAGADTLGLSGSDVSQLRGYAGQIRSASEQLAAADAGISLDSSMVGVAPWSMDLNTLALAPEYWARVEMTVADEQGNQSTGWMTMTGINSLDMTVGDLQAIIAGNAEAAAVSQGPGGTPRGVLLSTGRVELLVAPQA